MRLALVLGGSMLMLAAMSSSPAQAAQSPAELVRAEVAEVLAIVKDPSLDARTRREKLTRRIAASCDFESMAQSILTTHWKKASADKREVFVELFTRLLEQTYVAAIERHTTEVVQVGGERYRDGKATVIVTIRRQDHSDVPLLFKLRPDGEGWVVYDANVEGLSLVRHYRDSLGAIAASKGMPGVLAHLEEKTGG
jgi:phospholipid transport system substrate-binding protein